MKFIDNARGWLAAGAIAVGTMGAQGCGTEGQTENTNNGVAAEGSGGWERQDPDPATFRAATDTREEALAACNNFTTSIRTDLRNTFGQDVTVEQARLISQLTGNCVEFISKKITCNENVGDVGTVCAGPVGLELVEDDTPLNPGCETFSNQITERLIQTGKPTERGLNEQYTFAINCSGVLDRITEIAEETRAERLAEEARERENAEGSGDEGSGSEGSGT